jgi:hypothetical protein
MYHCLLLLLPLLQLLCDCRDCPGMGTYDKVVSDIAAVSVAMRGHSLLRLGFVQQQKAGCI